MLALAATSILLAQDGRDTAALRRDSAASLLVSDSAIAEVLAAFSSKENAVLLGRDYDPINPDTGFNYLGADGIPNTGDETNTAANNWNVTASDFACESPLNIQSPSINLTNTLSTIAGYRILAYRFDEPTMNGNLLVEGTHRGIPSYVHITLSLKDDLTDFPGIAADEAIYWQGRVASGTHSNFYFDPAESADTSLNSVGATSDADRGDYLNAIWSGALDGFATDNLQGDAVACNLTFSLPFTPKGTSLGAINSTLALNGVANTIREYQADSITLTGTDEVTVDTTNGPVHLYVKGLTTLRDSSKIRNVRTDGQSPKVGDLRIIQTPTLDDDGSVLLYDSPCLERVFIYAPKVNFHQLSTAGGCSGGIPSNVQGVVWAEDFENSTNSTSARVYDRQGDPDVPGSGVLAGIEVPEDIENMGDAIASLNLPRRFNISGVTAWNSVGL